MFAILVPAALAPLIITLLWAERKAQQLALLDSSRPRSRSNSRHPSLPQGAMIDRLLQTIEQLDLIGLFLLGSAISLILLPLTISQNAKGQWKNGSCSAFYRCDLGRGLTIFCSINRCNACCRSRVPGPVRNLGFAF